MAWRFLCLIAALLLGPGCARLQMARKPASKLPPMRLAPDAVALDVAFVRLAAIDGEVRPCDFDPPRTPPWRGEE